MKHYKNGYFVKSNADDKRFFVTLLHHQWCNNGISDPLHYVSDVPYLLYTFSVISLNLHIPFGFDNPRYPPIPLTVHLKLK